MSMVPRRPFLTSIAGAVIAVAGCTGSGSDNGGEVVVDERVFGDSTYNADVNEGDQVTISVDNEEGYATYVWVIGPDDDMVLEDTVETNAELEFEAESTGVYRFSFDVDGRASVEVKIE